MKSPPSPSRASAPLHFALKSGGTSVQRQRQNIPERFSSIALLTRNQLTYSDQSFKLNVTKMATVDDTENVC